MKNEVLDILILGLLVVLFASIYRKRATARLRCWVAGWILVLLHFAALLIPAVAGRGQEFVDSLSVSALFLSGVCFLFSAPVVAETSAGSALVALGVGLPALFYINYVVFGGVQAWPLYAAAMVTTVGGIVMAWKLCRRRSRVWAVISWPFRWAASGPPPGSRVMLRIKASWPFFLRFSLPLPRSTGSTSGVPRPAY
jgi:hypothetical protein